MTDAALWRRALAELLGTGLLVAIVVGSGAAAQRLSSDPGLRLLENSLATALGLGVLIVLLAPVSGAHFNPLVSAAAAFVERREGGLPDLAVYAVAQTAGAIGGAVLANLMFGIAAGISPTQRASAGSALGEVVATAGLILLVRGLERSGRSLPVVAAAVGAYIGAGYWFTSSTAFANPAVTIGRIFTDSFAGIAPASALAFLAAQLVGAAVGLALCAVLFPPVEAAGVTAAGSTPAPGARPPAGPHPRG